MGLERIKETIKSKVENFRARREFYSMMPIGNEKPFEVRVCGNKDENGREKSLIIPGYYPSDRVFEEIRNRVEPGSRIEIEVNLNRCEKRIINYQR